MAELGGIPFWFGATGSILKQHKNSKRRQSLALVEKSVSRVTPPLSLSVPLRMEVQEPLEQGCLSHPRLREWTENLGLIAVPGDEAQR